MKKLSFSKGKYWGSIIFTDEGNILSYHLAKNMPPASNGLPVIATLFAGDEQDGYDGRGAAIVYRFARRYGHESPMTVEEIEIANFLLSHEWECDEYEEEEDGY